jgi:5-(carboxyamino)imidazole ribonucleotide mutase
MADGVLVGILTGSASDLATMEQASAMLDRLGISNEVNVISAHRNPAQLEEYLRDVENRGMAVLICGAGLAAHLAGAVAARSVLPVIGVPLGTKYLGGADALYSTVQMPRGVPVATVAIDGAVNAAVLAAQIIGVGDPDVRERVRQFKADLAQGIKL